uniref:Uncharacterized protein n=1 Tax=Cacopsylla melanoneura TaxID=428564 RepID=A0A8D8PN50_9HEMI
MDLPKQLEDHDMLPGSEGTHWSCAESDKPPFLPHCSLHPPVLSQVTLLECHLQLLPCFPLQQLWGLVLSYIYFSPCLCIVQIVTKRRKYTSNTTVCLKNLVGDFVIFSLFFVLICPFLLSPFFLYILYDEVIVGEINPVK